MCTRPPSRIWRCASVLALLAAGCTQPAPPKAQPADSSGASASGASKAAAAAKADAKPKPPPKEALGEQLAVAGADKAIQAEQVVGDYRIGLGLHAPKAVYLPGAGSRIQDKPGKGADVYVVVTVREPRTKRHLPRAGVGLTIPRGAFKLPALPLLEVWDEFAHYGANVPMTKLGHEFILTVSVDPPSYGRHGDCVALWDKPATAKFLVKRDAGGLKVEGDPPAEADAGWVVGSDVAEAIGETRQSVDAGPYTVGWIVEGPEPVWRWDQGKAVPEPVPDQATNHLEIVLVEKESGRLVTGAGVTVTLTPAEAGRHPIEIPMLALMSEFHHYGATVHIPPGAYSVGVRVVRPTFTTLRADRLARTLSFTFPEPWVRKR